MNLERRWLRAALFLEEHLPVRFDWIGPWMRAAVCHATGTHAPTDDMCGIPQHRFCWRCRAPQPGLNRPPPGIAREHVAHFMRVDHAIWYRAQRGKGASA